MPSVRVDEPFMDFGETLRVHLSSGRSVRLEVCLHIGWRLAYRSALCPLLYQIFARAAEGRLKAPVCRTVVLFAEPTEIQNPFPCIEVLNF